MSKNLSIEKTGVETIIAPFTDHLAVVLRITMMETLARRGRRLWKMNNELLRDPTTKEELATNMREWTQHQHRYTNKVDWWGQYMKRKIKYLYIQRGADREKEDRK
jgi:hypothetical protein